MLLRDEKMKEIQEEKQNFKIKNNTDSRRKQSSVSVLRESGWISFVLPEKLKTFQLKL